MTPRELQYVGRSVFLKEVNTRNFWNFKLRTEEGIWILVGLHRRDRQPNQNLSNDTLYRPPVTFAQCITGTDKIPDSVILIIYKDVDYSQGYRQNKQDFRALTNDDILQSYISDHDFISSNDADDTGHNLYVFDIRY